MKRYISYLLIAVFMAISVVITGCGSLNQNINYTYLTKSNMELADKAEPNLPTLFVDVPGKKFVTKDTVNKYFFIPPIHYWECFGSNGGEYGYMNTWGVMPLIFSMNGSVYDSSGVVSARVSCDYFSPLYLSARAEAIESKKTTSLFSFVPIPLVSFSLYNQMSIKDKGEIISSRYEFLYLPIIGPCFATRNGDETGYPRFLWIPCGKKM